MSFQGPDINRRQGGLGRTNGNTDGVFAMLVVLSAAALSATTCTVNTAYPLYQPQDAEDLGINASLDANNKILARHAVDEFFRVAPESMMYLIPVVPGTPVAILGTEAIITAIRAKKDIKGLGIVGTTETKTELAAIAEDIQEWVDDFEKEKRLIDIVVLQGNGEPVPVSIAAYHNNRTLNAPNVYISIAQDPDIAALEPEYAKYACVGSVLGGFAVRSVNESLGSVDILRKPASRAGEENYTLSTGGRFAKASLSDGKSFDSLGIVNQKLLTAKGYIYAGSFEGYDGVYFNGAPGCVEISSDYAWGENIRVWNKAARAIRTKIIPTFRTTLKKNAATGYLTNTSAAAFEEKAKGALDPMEKAGEISGFSVYVDARQVVNDQSPLKMKVNIVRDEILHELTVDLGFSATT